MPLHLCNYNLCPGIALATHQVPFHWNWSVPSWRILVWDKAKPSLLSSIDRTAEVFLPLHRLESLFSATSTWSQSRRCAITKPDRELTSQSWLWSLLWSTSFLLAGSFLQRRVKS
jgi:hypothetical protein